MLNSFLTSRPRSSTMPVMDDLLHLPGRLWPTLSIVTPSFRQARYIEATLQSVLRQRADVHEYFVMDGGSDDGTVDLLRRYEAQLTGWVSEKDAGQGDAINKGFARCTGELLGWLNSDDVYLPGALSAVRAAFAADPELDFVAGWSLRVDEACHVIRAKRWCVGSPAQARAGMLANQPACFFRRSLFEKVGPLDTSLWLALDSDLFYRMFRVVRRMRSLPRYLAACRVQPEAKCQLYAQGKLPEALIARETKLIDARFPEFRFPSMGSRGRRLIWRMQFYIKERAGEMADTRHWRGRSVDEIFP